MGTHTQESGQDLKVRGQRRSTRDAEPDHYAAVVAAIESVAPGAEFTVNDLRAQLDAAGVPFAMRGGLFARAVTSGLLTPLEIVNGPRTWRAFDSSTGKSAHHAQVRVYRRGVLGLSEAGEPLVMVLMTQAQALHVAAAVWNTCDALQGYDDGPELARFNVLSGVQARLDVAAGLPWSVTP